MSTQPNPITGNLFDYSSIQAALVAGIKANAAAKNADTMAKWKSAVNDYLTNAAHVEELNQGAANPIPMPVKPDPSLYILVIVADAPTTDQNHLPISVTYTNPPAAPDPLPLPPPPAAGTIDVGVYDYGNHGVGGYWSSGVNDTYKGTAPVPATSRDGVTGTWQKIPFFMGNGWYLRVT